MAFGNLFRRRFTPDVRSFATPSVGQKRVAVLQFEGVHEEVVPSLVRALETNGISVDVFLNERCRQNRGDLFQCVDGISCSVTYVPLEKAGDWRSLAAHIDNADYNALVFSTYQRDGIAKWAAERKLPIIGVVHNAPMFVAAESCMETLSSGQARLLTLAPHVAGNLNIRLKGAYIDQIDVVEPVFWGERSSAATLDEQSERTIAIPGGVSFKSRDFEKLISCLSGPTGSKTRDRGIVFHILGGGGDRAALEDMIKRNMLEDCIRLAPLGRSGRVVYTDYIGALEAASMLHPLTPVSFPPYRDHKITSAIPTALGFGLPIVLDRWTEATYRTPCVVSNATVEASVLALLQLGDGDADQLRDASHQYYLSALSANAASIGRFL